MSSYVPKPDIEGINSPGQQTPLKDAAILVAGFLGIVFAFYFIFTTVTDFVFTRVSPETEMKYLGKIWMSDDETKKSSPDFNRLIQRMNAETKLPLKASIICDKTPNAFALPGGVIYVTSGLFKKVHTENGLGFVIAHEIGHFKNRDHIRGVGRQIVFAIGAAMFGFADMGGISALNQLMTRSFDRNQEADADTYALELSRKVFGHTWGAEEFFSEMSKEETAFDKSLARFASTHPASSERLARIRATQTNEPHELENPQRPFATWVVEAGCD
jgi:beta-barrel assembly-enhancing protease